jgi:hypothetical protein
MRPRDELSRAWLVRASLLTLAATGCSALVSRPPPAHPLVEERDCSRGRAPEIVDSIAAGVAGGFTGIFAASTLLEYESEKDDVQPSWDVHSVAPSKGLLITTAVGAATTFALIASARYGRESSRACDAARAELRLRDPYRWAPRPRWAPPPAMPPPASGPWAPPAPPSTAPPSAPPAPLQLAPASP